LKAEEPLSRCIFSRDYFNPAKGLVKPKAFAPPSDLKTSVCRIAALAETDVWFRAERVGVESGRTLLARADLNAAQVARARLVVQPTWWPIRHANLAGWPFDKGERLSIAQSLAQHASLHVKEQGPARGGDELALMASLNTPIHR